MGAAHGAEHAGPGTVLPEAAGGGAAPAEQVRLGPFTTLGVGGPARRLVSTDTEADLVAAVRAADERGEPLLVLGGGSNLVIADEGFPGLVLRVATRGIDVSERADGAVAVTVAAGEDWDGVVAWSVAEGLAGLECLSGIPGLAGATPIQNVGAYGQEVAQTAVSVRVYDRRRGEVTELSAAQCGFGYRDSMFKRSARAVDAAADCAAALAESGTGAASPHAGGSGAAAAPAATGRYVVLSVTFALDRSPLSRPIAYAELARALGAGEGGRAALGDVRAAVLALRRGKGMVLDRRDPDTRSAGSFFTNPVLDEAAFAEVERIAARRCGPKTRVPRFPAGPGLVKVPAAWLIERAGFGKGYRPAGGRAMISSKHTLALVNPGDATAADVVALAREIHSGVRAAFGVDLAAEPVLVGGAL